MEKTKLGTHLLDPFVLSELFGFYWNMIKILQSGGNGLVLIFVLL